MKFEISPIFCFLVYMILLLISLGIIYSGPFCEYVKHENRYVQNYQKIRDLKESLKWPDLILCKSPMIKSQENYLNFMTKVREPISMMSAH